MKHTHVTIILGLLCLMMIFSGCDHKELCFMHPHIAQLRVRFDWRDAPEAHPAGMCVFFYPEEGGEPVRFDFNNTLGGRIELPEGRYRVISYNNDTEATRFDSHHIFDGHRAYTRPGDILEPVLGPGTHTRSAFQAPEAQEEAVMICPDDLWGCTATEIDVRENGITYTSHPLSEKGNFSGPTYSGDQVITLYPHDMLCHYSFEVRNVEGLEHITRLGGSISGMSPALYLNNEELHRQCVTLPFAGYVNDEDQTLRGEFLTFGHHEENTQPHRMMFYLWLDDGSKYLLGGTEDKFNVTEQVHSAPDCRRVHIILEDIKIPGNNTPPFGGENGEFDPSVDDWFEVDETIKI